MRLDHPAKDKLQQGAIFNCVSVPSYDGCRCYGIVLTARCDLEHEKNSVINYLPIVPFAEWARRSLCFILANRTCKELRAEIGNAFNKKGIPDRVQRTFPTAEIATREFSEKEAKQLLEKLDQIKKLEKALSSNGDLCPDASDVIEIAGKRATKTIEDLLQHKLAEFYFLESTDVDDHDTPTGYVVLLRHMRTMGKDLGRRIPAGIEAEKSPVIRELRHHLTFDLDPICMVTGVLRSPDVEHLAQQFANGFVRIGLEDYSATTIAGYCKTVKNLR